MNDFLEGRAECRYSLREIRAEVRRELVMRRAVYPRLIAAQELTLRQAQVQYSLMEQAFKLLESMADQEAT
jgi:hypothetical protein